MVHLKLHWRASTDSPRQKVSISDDVKHQLSCGILKSNLTVGVPFRKPQHEHVMYTDASNWGWGAHIGDNATQGVWNHKQNRKHINVKELLAVIFGLKYFEPIVQNTSVLIATDNTTVVAYINKEGGTVSRNLCFITMKLYRWAQRNNVTISARHIPGSLNILADKLSRSYGFSQLEWALNESVTHAIWQLWGTPQIDLFATWLNKRLSTYVSPIPDSQAFAVDAFSINWKGLYLYAFPPFAILTRVLYKFRHEGQAMILIAPRSPQYSWYPEMLDLLADYPRKLPNWHDLLTQQGARLNNAHALYAWY